MTNNRWIDIRYKCKFMPAEATVQLTERRVEEEIMEFMARVQSAIGADHQLRSPLCRSDTMEYAKVPVGGDVIGGAEGGRA